MRSVGNSSAQGQLGARVTSLTYGLPRVNAPAGKGRSCGRPLGESSNTVARGVPRDEVASARRTGIRPDSPARHACHKSPRNLEETQAVNSITEFFGAARPPRFIAAASLRRDAHTVY